MTIRVILADDEPLIIKGLRKLIHWEALGMEIVAHAYDGQELLEVIGSHSPDIVISDISMPFLSGIDIIKEINSRNLAVKVIFISAYQEFSYARDAVAYGAVDYLVKPVVKQQLEDVLRKAASLIKEESEKSRSKIDLQRFEKAKQTEETKDRFIRLIDGSLPTSTDAYRQLIAQLQGPLFTIGLVELDRIVAESDRWSGQQQKLIAFAVENILNEIVAGTGRGRVFMKNHLHVVLFEHGTPDEPMQIAHEAKQKIGSFLKLNVSVGLSKPVATGAELAQAFAQAERALQSKYFIGLNRVIVSESHTPKASIESELYALQLEIIRGLTNQAWDEVKSGLAPLLRAIRSATIGNASLAVSTCFSSILFIVQEIKKSGVQLPDWGFDLHGLQRLLEEYETFDEMERGVYHIVEELYQRIDDKGGNKEKLVLTKIKQYIEEHYSEEISLESVSAIAFMNPYYFSSFFKKHTRQNFKQYVTEIRMKQAVSLLNQTDLMVYEIAEKVGYNNARHFSDMFKKHYGKLPMEYKQALRK
ncbi:response regulator [Cohnella cholangitidis]|uniref:Response regulator n=1 Tax=Cohnella cholangitidis TaxID=2598458 RepID=A0A7G5BVF9_9BACL|nr:response regulator [Cohnella cholangitidis]QMV40943.1 response regulator [Cohnella cholangitidis]